MNQQSTSFIFPWTLVVVQSDDHDRFSSTENCGHSFDATNLLGLFLQGWRLFRHPIVCVCVSWGWVLVRKWNFHFKLFSHLFSLLRGLPIFLCAFFLQCIFFNWELQFSYIFFLQTHSFCWTINSLDSREKILRAWFKRATRPMVHIYF